jgi:endonuclease/exonuclease/phosphatase family metal-dependent hydrolase
MHSSFEYSDNQSLIAELKGFKTLSELYASEAFQRHQTYLKELFETPQLFPAYQARPRIRDFVRIAHWNIEKGKHLDAVIRSFRQHPILREADLISINEADVGMNRSAHRFVARELGEALGMHVLFAPVYLEFSKGYGDDLKMPGENSVALQGNAILSRYNLSDPQIIQLPVCFDPFSHIEKRIGKRNAVAVEVEIDRRKMVFVSSHLEVRHIPACRARQMKAIIEALRQPELSHAAIIAGDFNTNATPRGGLWRTLRASLRLSFANRNRLKYIFAMPQPHEPLFDLLYQNGFTEKGFNDTATTCIVVMKGFEDRTTIPKFLADIFEYRMGRFDHRINFRLDWIVGRKIKPLVDGEIVDSASGIVSLGPQSIAGLTNENGEQISDHDPITADVILKDEAGERE